MIFILRTDAARPDVAGIDIKLCRSTPDVVRDGAGKTDWFCAGDPEAARAAGWAVVPVHDGWYADDTGGGVAVWGQGKFWEVRETPFTVRETDGGIAAPAPPPAADAEVVNVRGAIFGV